MFSLNKRRLRDATYSKFLTLLWSIVLIVGSAIFIGYYASIGYMPSFDASSITALLVTASITSILIFFSLALLFVFPGLIWNLYSEESRLNSYWANGADTEILFNLLIWFSIPTFICYTLLFHSLLPYEFIILLILVYITLLVYKTYNKSIKIGDFLIHFFVVIFGAALTFFPFEIVLKLFIAWYKNLEDGYWLASVPDWILLMLITLPVILLNTFAVIFSRKKMLGFTLVAIFSLFLLFKMFSGWMIVPNKVMSLYQFGNFEVSQIVLKEQGCQTIDVLGIKPSLNGRVCSVRCIKIESRLGKQAYLSINKDNMKDNSNTKCKLASKDDKKFDRLKFTIPSNQIESWVVNADKASKESEEDKKQSISDKENTN